jgi:hypothetical protein
MAENVIIKHGHFRVEPWRMKKVLTQELNETEKERYAKNREEWLDWMNSHFADKTILAPDKYK